ncbi:MAG: FHA domain-containing protein [Phycisphaerales bacterium]
MEVNLVVFKPNGKRAEVGLQTGSYIIGRDEKATLRIPIRSVSRTHCELVVGDDEVALRDLGSTNGTKVNGDKVQNTIIKAGDVVGVGNVQIVFQIDGEPKTVDRPEGEDLDLDLDLDDTPPGALSSPKPGAKKAPAPLGGGSGDSSMMDERAASRDRTTQPSAGDAGDSSAFDFDFDFTDDQGDKNKS